MHTEERVINGKTIVIQRIMVMDYNGEWKDAGYDVRLEPYPNRYHFAGYPTNSDLESVSKIR